jgi:hypothetical protein
MIIIIDPTLQSLLGQPTTSAAAVVHRGAA